ncbi:HNH endonuclease [Kocuria turfanensis]|uniref:HNH endonuclease n=1 Tax=Kocuria turfanensis TaxID=388357 RepID=UPI000A7E113F
MNVGDHGTMAISDKTRRILWARSGNRCALCRRRLVEDRTELSSESVVGEEAHIVARSPGGPRYEPLPGNGKDELDNLLLLCRVHHKQVDDQIEEFPAGKLRKIKGAHERWVADTLDAALEASDPEATPIPALHSGADIWSVVAGAEAYDFHGLEEPDAPKNLVDASDGFLQEAHDWGEISDDVKLQGFGSIREAKRSLSTRLDELRALGLRVFGAQNTRAVTHSGVKVQLCVATIAIAQEGDSRIHIEEPPDEVF